MALVPPSFITSTTLALGRGDLQRHRGVEVAIHYDEVPSGSFLDEETTAPPSALKVWTELLARMHECLAQCAVWPTLIASRRGRRR
jgi:hypothetical protein